MAYQPTRFEQGSSPQGARPKPHLVFLALYLVVATLTALLIPAGAGLDEPNHLARIDQITRGSLLPHTVEADGVDTRYCDLCN